jgi:uncharacterized membrane protein
MDKLGLVAAGALAHYLLDGVSGRRRRRRWLQRLRSLERHAEVGLGRAMRDLANRTEGAAAELSGGLRVEHPPDEVLAGRVRARIGRLVAHPHAVTSEVKDGKVMLSGAVRESETLQLVEGVRAIRGVREVEEAGERRPQSPTRRASPAMKLLLGVLGGAVLGWARRKRSPGLELVGLYAAVRALFARDRSSIELHKTLHVRAPIDVVFQYFSDFENFSRFMTHVRHVRVFDGLRSHWVVEGPAGVPVEWDARITTLDPNRLVAWRTEPGSAIHHQGRIRFFPEDGGTRMEIQLAYRPPAGAFGHALAWLFGRDPKHEMDDDLLRFKSLLEEGKARGREGSVSREDLYH